MSDLEGIMRKGLIIMKKGILIIPLIFLFLVVAGCASYGKLRLQSGPGENMTIQQLKENWQNYHILATGVEPGVPSAIVFDRKDDGREITGERWWELKDYKLVSETIGWIETQISPGPYYPRLWKILGPDDHLYGYMFTAWDHAVMSVGEDKTLSLLDIPMPPSMAVGAGQMREPK
jgi:hypothetical protein